MNKSSMLGGPGRLTPGLLRRALHRSSRRICDTFPTRVALFELIEVTRHYPMGDVRIAALDGVSFAVDPGEMVAIVGSSGSGKSTLLNILGCLDTITSGAYTLGGRNVGCLSDNERSALRNRQIGFVFQGFRLLPRTTAVKNVALPLVYRGIGQKARLSTARSVLQRVGLADRADHRPNQLSGGQRQRVAIARALVGEPSVLLADEPTGNLDSSTGREIFRLFCKLHADGNTIVMVTHDPIIAAQCPRAIRLVDGRIVADGPGDAIARSVADSVREAT